MIGAGWCSFQGRVGDNRPHAHHALQLTIGVDRPIRARIGSGLCIEAPGLLIAADVHHALQPGPGRARLFYVERESNPGRRLAGLCPQGYRVLDSTLCESLLRAWPTEWADKDASVEPFVLLLAGPDVWPCIASDRRTQARVRAAISMLSQRVEQPATLALLAEQVALSPSRFAHCFREQTGMAVRPYLRWLRLGQALEVAAQGADLTQAAHSAGFADVAHLTRTMRQHFGVAPSHVLASLRAPDLDPA